MYINAKILPKFACQEPINRNDEIAQVNFLQQKRIAVTDLLISINDADINNEHHCALIRNFLDNALNEFHQFTWNTQPIIDFIVSQNIKSVYFTRSRIYNDIFDQQLTIIQNITGVTIQRLHTPSGQGLRIGQPRANKLIHTWFNQGANDFPFLYNDFDIESPDLFWE